MHADLLRLQTFAAPQTKNAHSNTSTRSSQGIFNVAFEVAFHPTLCHPALVEAGLGVLDGGQVALNTKKLADSVEGHL